MRAQSQVRGRVSLPGLLPWAAAALFAAIAAITASMLLDGKPGSGGGGGEAEKPKEGIEVDAEARAASIPAAVAKQGTYEVLKGAIEYVLVAKGGKDYETLFVTDEPPEKIHAALLRIGLEPGKPASPDELPSGKGVRILAEYEHGGKKIRRPVDEFVVHKDTGKPLEGKLWTFTGSVKTADPESGKEMLQCAITKSIVGLHLSDPSPLFQNSRAEARSENIYKANAAELPPAGTAVRIVFEREKPKAAPGTRRARAFVTGRVQAVGFRAFVQREAKKLKLTGWVRNLEDGRVEALLEGPEADVASLLKLMERGPRAARVEKLETRNETPEGDFEEFEIRG